MRPLHAARARAGLHHIRLVASRQADPALAKVACTRPLVGCRVSVCYCAPCICTCSGMGWDGAWRTFDAVRQLRGRERGSKRAAALGAPQRRAIGQAVGSRAGCRALRPCAHARRVVEGKAAIRGGGACSQSAGQCERVSRQPCGHDGAAAVAMLWRRTLHRAMLSRHVGGDISSMPRVSNPRPTRSRIQGGNAGMVASLLDAGAGCPRAARLAVERARISHSEARHAQHAVAARTGQQDVMARENEVVDNTLMVYWDGVCGSAPLLSRVRCSAGRRAIGLHAGATRSNNRVTLNLKTACTCATVVLRARELTEGVRPDALASGSHCARLALLAPTPHVGHMRQRVAPCASVLCCCDIVRPAAAPAHRWRWAKLARTARFMARHRDTLPSAQTNYQWISGRAGSRGA